MTKKSRVEEFLDKELKFRERKFKDRGIVHLLMGQYTGLKKAVDEGLITKESLTAFVQDYASMDRAWRQALERRPELRGKDYDEKAELEINKQRELGYPV